MLHEEPRGCVARASQGDGVGMVAAHTDHRTEEGLGAVGQNSRTCISSQRRGSAMAWAGWKGSELSVTKHMLTGPGGPPVWVPPRGLSLQIREEWASRDLKISLIFRILSLDLPQGRGISKRHRARTCSPLLSLVSISLQQQDPGSSTSQFRVWPLPHTHLQGSRVVTRAGAELPSQSLGCVLMQKVPGVGMHCSQSSK